MNVSSGWWMNIFQKKLDEELEVDEAVEDRK